MDFLFQNLAVFFGLIVLAFLSCRKIEYGIYAIIFSLPLYLIKLEILGIPTTFLELSIYILFIIWFFKKNAQQDFANLFGLLDKKLKIGIALLLAGAIISTIFSSDLRTSAGILKGWFFDPFLFFVILVSTVKNYEQRSNILKAFFISGTIVAIASLIYLVFPDLDGVSYDGRLHGFYLSPNHLAMYLSPAFILGVWLIYRKHSAFSWKENSSNIMFFLSVFDLILIGLAIYYTYSYAAWFAVFISLFFLIRFIIPPAKKKIFIAAIFLILVALILSQTGTSKFENLKNLADRSSYSSRLIIWRSALEIGKDNPILGIGPGNFQKYYLEYQTRFSEPYLEWAVPEPHNIFLAFWLETGILGLVGFFAILAWFLKRGLFLLKSNLPNRENFLLAAVLFSVMVYTIMHGLFDTTYWKNDLAVIFWTILALLAVIKKQPSIG